MLLSGLDADIGDIFGGISQWRLFTLLAVVSGSEDVTLRIWQESERQLSNSYGQL